MTRYREGAVGFILIWTTFAKTHALVDRRLAEGRRPRAAGWRLALLTSVHARERVPCLIPHQHGLVHLAHDLAQVAHAAAALVRVGVGVRVRVRVRDRVRVRVWRGACVCTMHVQLGSICAAASALAVGKILPSWLGLGLG